MKELIGELETVILERLVAHNYEAMVVGGAVRDYKLDRSFQDIDIATNAPYDKLIDIMSDLGTVDVVGKNFGVLMVNGIEIATYRTESCKDNVVLEVNEVSNAYEDSLRRDFTVNALYYDYRIDKIWDFHNSSLDFRNKIIKAVGDPYDRFNEDYSRILRAVHLAASLDFDIERVTGKAMTEFNYCLETVPNALVGKIFRKSIKSGSFHKFLQLLEEFDLLSYILPEMVHAVGTEQNPKYHQYDVWDHTLQVIKSAEMVNKGDIAILMGALLHDNAKGTEGIRSVNKECQPSDHGHEEAGVSNAFAVCKRLELGKDITNDVIMYVRWHGTRMIPTIKSVKNFLFKFKEEFKNIDELKENFYKLFYFMNYDASGFSEAFSKETKQLIKDILTVAPKVFKQQIFYTNQFDFNASIIANHKNVRPIEIKETMEFFIRNNIKQENKVLSILERKNLNISLN